MDVKTKQHNTLLIGGISGLISQGTTYPFEYLKIIKQLPNYDAKIGVMNYLWKDIKQGNIKKIYNGSLSHMIVVFPRTAIKFYTFEKLNKNTNLSPIMSGIMAGVIECVIGFIPSEVIKIKIINNKMRNINSSMSQVIRQIYNNDGIKGFYKGGNLTIMRHGLSQGVCFWINSKSKYICKQLNIKDTYCSIYSGILGGFLGTVVNNPFDVVKTYKQSSNYNNDSISTITKKIYNKGGYSEFYNGFSIRALKMVPLYSIMFFSYDKLHNYL
jgi:hypothetical protein